MNITTATPDRVTPQPAARPVSPLLYPILLTACISVIVASLLGIAAMTGLLPQAQSQVQTATASAPAGKTAADAATAKTAAKIAVAPKAAFQTAAANAPATRIADTKAAAAPAHCEQCGVVESVRAIEVKGEGSGVGAVAGGAVGGILGNQVGGVSYEIRVRMDNSSYRSFRSDQPDVGVGQRVTVRDGRLALAG